MQKRREGIKESENIADVKCTWPQRYFIWLFPPSCSPAIAKDFAAGTVGRMAGEVIDTGGESGSASERASKLTHSRIVCGNSGGRPKTDCCVEMLKALQPILGRNGTQDILVQWENGFMVCARRPYNLRGEGSPEKVESGYE